MISIEYWLVRILFFVITHLSEKGLIRLSKFLAFFAEKILRYRYGVVESNINLAFPEKTIIEKSKIRKKFYLHFSMLWIEVLHGLHLDENYYCRNIKFENLQILENAARQGKGVLLVTGHLGNFEWLGNALNPLFPGKIAAVMKKIHNPRVNEFIYSLRKKFYNDLIYSTGTGKKIITLLRKGNFLLLAADQDARTSDLFVDFLGQASASAAGMAALHLSTGAPIIFFAAIREHFGKFKISFSEIKIPESVADRETQIFFTLQSYSYTLEKWIREFPGQWFWSHRRWKRKPSAIENEILSEKLLQFRSMKNI